MYRLVFDFLKSYLIYMYYLHVSFDNFIFAETF